jgi:hypothetical protein
MEQKSGTRSRKQNRAQIAPLLHEGEQLVRGFPLNVAAKTAKCCGMS